MEQLLDDQGNRLYITGAERAAIEQAARLAPREVRMFVLVLLYTGARPSEVCALDSSCVDLERREITYKTLKQGERTAHRRIPIPQALVDQLDLVFDLRVQDKESPSRLWTWSRSTAWRRVKSVMDAASVTGPQATAKGFRHGFAIWALETQAPLHQVKEWLGHRQITTTQIYTTVAEGYGRKYAEKMWTNGAG